MRHGFFSNIIRIIALLYLYLIESVFGLPWFSFFLLIPFINNQQNIYFQQLIVFILSILVKIGFGLPVVVSYLMINVVMIWLKLEKLLLRQTTLIISLNILIMGLLIGYQFNMAVLIHWLISLIFYHLTVKSKLLRRFLIVDKYKLDSQWFKILKS
jgi:hypothetical protein